VDRKEELERSVQLVQEMVDEMCASIPYGFGEDDRNERVGVREGDPAGCGNGFSLLYEFFVSVVGEQYG
jgi:hypothetical protein